MALTSVDPSRDRQRERKDIHYITLLFNLTWTETLPTNEEQQQQQPNKILKTRNRQCWAGNGNERHDDNQRHGTYENFYVNCVCRTDHPRQQRQNQHKKEGIFT